MSMAAEEEGKLQHVTLMRAGYCPSSRERGFGFQWEGGEESAVHPQIPHAPNCWLGVGLPSCKRLSVKIDLGC